MGALIIINGDDDFLKERAAFEEASMSLADRKIQFSFPQDRDRYLEFLDASSLSTEKETVIIWDAIDVPIVLGDRVTIVVAAKGKTLSSNEAKRVVNVKKPKPYDGGIEYIKWVLNEGERLRIDLSRVASALFVNCGTDLRKICSEIEKLRVIRDSHDAIEPVTARRVMCFSAELTPKNVVDAICDGHPAKALSFYDKLQERGSETGWIIAYMQRHVIQQLRAELLERSGVPRSDAASVFGMHPIFYEKTISSRMGLWTISSLQESLATLCDLDLLHKRGIDVSCWGLEIEIIRLSEEARQNVASRNSGD